MLTLTMISKAMYALVEQERHPVSKMGRAERRMNVEGKMQKMTLAPMRKIGRSS